jgi:hypothetical protein
MKKLSLFYFILGLSIGLFIVYINASPPKVITVYPNPDNYNKFQYVDNVKNCFVINQKETKCSDNEDDIIQIPIQY